METCYACDNKAVSREHITPMCFFPERKDFPNDKDYRRDLITVPSCIVHNLHKAYDDEYRFFIIASHLTANQIAQLQFSSKVLRAIKKEKSKIGIFTSNYYSTRVNGLKTIAFIVDKKRFDRLMSLIAMGLHFHHFQQKWSKPIIIQSPSLINIGNINVNRDLQSLDGMAIQFLGEVPLWGTIQRFFHIKFIEEEIQII
jgi:hypothetical protein